jgi:hypothetical protein
VARQPKQDSEDRAKHDSKDCTAEDRTADTGQLEQDSWNRTAGTGQLEQDSLNKTARTGHLGQDSKDRTVGTE